MSIQNISDRERKLQAQVDALKKAVAEYELALKATYPEGAHGAGFDHWNEARIILKDTND